MKCSIMGPLRKPLFRMFFFAALFSNIGTWMHDVGTAWLMTGLTSSPLMVALLQTAVYTPFFFMALPAGALADIFDRRVMLLLGHIWMFCAALALAALAFFGLASPWLLIACTFALGLGAAISAPAWNALTPELVARKHLSSAVALSSVSFNVARGLGSVAGGLLVAQAGPAFVFLANAVSFLGLILFFQTWKRRPQDGFQHTEGVFEAIRNGVRYVRHSPELVSVLVRAALFALSASAFWALLPLVCRNQLHFNATQYGIALGLFGLGTLLGAYTLPRIRNILSLDHCCVMGTLIFSSCVICLAWSNDMISAGISMFWCGASWILVNSSLNLAAQLAVPSWVRARALAFYIVVCQGGVAIGSLFWGTIATLTDIILPLFASGIALALSLTAIARFPLLSAESIDVTQSKHWDDPNLEAEPEPEHGPVMVTVEYLIDPERTTEFTQVMAALRAQRLRGGAFQWHLFQDLAQAGRHVETYLVQSWAEHMRQHERVTVGDRMIEDKAMMFHIGPSSPVVQHYLSSYASMSQQESLSDNNPGETTNKRSVEHRYLLRM